MTASRLLANSRRASRQPLRTGPISPPSGARVMSSGGSDEGLALATISSWGRSGSGQPDSRIGDGQRDVGHEVAQYGQHRADQRVGQQYRVVLVLQGGVEQQAQAVVVEDDLGDEVAGK